MAEEPLPYWLVNVPTDQRPEKCPEFLKNIGPRDRQMISTPTDQFHRLTWSEVQHNIDTNRIDLFSRAPVDHRNYLNYSFRLKKEYGSIMDFVVQKRLQWNDLTPKDTKPFADQTDFKIIYNDWPYGIDEKIIHLVVWTKFNLEDDPATDDLTPEMRAEIDRFVDKMFCREVPTKKVIWFKNWRSLKSIHAVEHFHVMLYDPDMRFIKEITNGDIPAYKKV